jgi:hypothetical protein
MAVAGPGATIAAPIIQTGVSCADPMACLREFPSSIALLAHADIIGNGAVTGGDFLPYRFADTGCLNLNAGHRFRAGLDNLHTLIRRA